MDPEALEKAFEIYPDVRLVVLAHLYGTHGKIEEIKRICDAHGALIVEDAAESLGATYNVSSESALAEKLGKSGAIQTGTFGDYNAISFNGNNVFKIEGDVDFCNKELKSRLKGWKNGHIAQRNSSLTKICTKHSRGRVTCTLHTARASCYN